MISVEFCKTGTPYRAFRAEPQEPPFVPFIVKGTIFNERDDGSRDMYIDTGICLSNGNGPTRGLTCFNLTPNGTVRHYYYQYDRISSFVTDVDIKSWFPESWSWNEPTWIQLYYKESRDAALAFLMIWRRLKKTTFRHIVLDIAKMIAKMIYGSFRDVEWGETVKSTKRRKI